MKSRLIIIFAFLIIISMFLIFRGYRDSEKEKLNAIYDGASKCTNQLANQPGIRFMGFAGQQDKRFFKVLIKVDRKKASFEEFKEVVISYISSSATYASINDWKVGLKPYHFRIEEMTTDNKTPAILVEKTTGSTEITWKTQW